jgi:branched-subunit amino acid ABC-type transport system permease component
MFDLTQIVWIMLYLIGAVIIFGLLKLLIDRNPWIPLDWKPTLNYILLALGIIAIIFVILSFITGTPILRVGGPRLGMIHEKVMKRFLEP